MSTSLTHTRRAVLAGSGALVVSFASGARAAVPAAGQPGPAKPSGPARPGSLAKVPYLDSWIRVEPSGKITIFTGKAELGQGIRTALLQVAAEELDASPSSLILVTADTGLTPNEGYTAGSHSMQDSGTALRNAAAQVRDLLLAAAAARLKVDRTALSTEEGAVIAPDGTRLGYGELVIGQNLHVEAAPDSRLRDPQAFKVMGRSIPRVDIPAKVTGGQAYVQDFRPKGLVHARVVRPPSPGARLIEVNVASVERMPGVLNVVRDGRFLAVIARREFQAVKAMRALAAAARWEEGGHLPRQAELFDVLTSMPSEDHVIQDSPAAGLAVRKLEARYTRPYQIHGSIGPSCAVAQLQNGTLTVWTHTQGVYPDRAAIAEMVGMPADQVHCIHLQGSGCYGHNGADDAAADAALLARAMPEVPVRVQWMREQEHAWEPKGPAMVTRVSAGLDGEGRVVGWDYAVWSNTHSTRPGPAGALLAARHLARPFAEPAPKPLPLPEGGGDRNAIPLYRFGGTRVVHHFLPEMPLRVSALRGLGAYMNVFSIESFVDELAAAAGADPVEFRLRHLEDPRAREVIKLAAERFGWPGSALPRARGRGFAFARYKNLAAYCALAVEIEVERETGRPRILRAVAAVDSGEVVNPDGIRNQIEGGILQSASWTLFEQVSFDETRITSVDWASYPILRFASCPDRIDVHVVPRPGAPFLGTGEAAQGPAAAAIANALASATGSRLRDLPFSRDKIRAAIGV